MQQLHRQVRLIAPHPPNLELPLFVFLPGLDGTGLLLRSQIPHLSKAFDIRCLSIPPDDFSSWDSLVAQTIKAIARELEFSGKPGKVAQEGRSQHHRPVYLCGESFGGCLALQIALRAPQLWQKLILVNPASCFRQQPFINWGSYLTRLLPKFIYPLSSLWLLPFLGALQRMRPSDRQALLAAMQSLPQKTTIWRLQLLRSFYLQPTELKKLQGQVLLIASAADQLLHSLSHARFLLKQIPKAQMVALPRSGHACLLERDVDLHQILWEYLFF